MYPPYDTSGDPSTVPSYVQSVNTYRAPSEQQVGDLQEEIRTTLEQVNTWKILLHQEILSMNSVSFPSGKLILLLCSLFCLSKVHPGSKPILFLFRFLL